MYYYMLVGDVFDKDCIYQKFLKKTLHTIFNIVLVNYANAIWVSLQQ